MKRWILLVTGVAMAILMVLSLTVWKNWIKASFYIRMMEADFRQENMQVDRIVETLRIRPGQEIADIGAGSGLFTRKFARRSKGGVVFAADINEELLQYIAETAREEGLKNVETVLSRETDPDLPRAVDLIFLCDTLHFIERQAEYMKVLSRYLKPEGRIAVISFAEGWPPLAHEFTEKELIEWMESLGFRVAEKHDFIKDQYLIIFDKHGTGDQIGPARM